MKQKILYVSISIFIFSKIVLSQVSQEWARTYNGPLAVNSSDLSVSIAKDNSGNIIVGGTTTNNITGSDFYVIKYKPSGIRLWSKTFNYFGNERLAKLTADNSGNIYATGSSGYDFLLVKFNPNGDTV